MLVYKKKSWGFPGQKTAAQTLMAPTVHEFVAEGHKKGLWHNPV